MAWFYVSSVIGTKTTGGGFATQQTGSFSTAPLGAANVYASIGAAIADSAADGDIINVSDAHAHSTATQIDLVGGVSSELSIECVEDLNCDITSSGGSETTTGTTADIRFDNILSITGVDFTCGDLFSVLTDSHIVLSNSTLTLSNSGNDFSISADGIYFEMNNVIMDFNYSTNNFLLSNGANLTINDSSIIYTTSTTGTYLTHAGFANGGGTLYVTATDLGAITGNIVNGVGSAIVGDDCIDVVFDGCKVNATSSFHSENFSGRDKRLRATRCSSSSLSAEYQDYFHSVGGTVEDDTSFYRDLSTAFMDSSQKVSLKCSTLTTASPGNPFVFKFPTRIASLSTATDTIRLFLLSASTLTDADVYVKVVYPDGTTKNVFNTVFSVASAFSVNRAGTTLTANTDAWTGRTTENRYQIDIDTSVDPGIDCVPEITVYVTKASAFIYFDTSLDVV